MGRPECGVDDYHEWQRRLESYESSDLDLNLFCLQEGVSRSTFYRWRDRLKDGILSRSNLRSYRYFRASRMSRCLFRFP
jgi:hypothetical protein